MMRKLATFVTFRFSQASPVVIEYQDLKNHKNLDDKISEAYGPKGLGILFVNGIPNYPQQRQITLPLFNKIAQLPKETLKKYERPQIYHSKGWSCGVEQFKGKYDTSKGSYYVNCASDQSYKIKKGQEGYFSEQEKKLYVGNKWIDEYPEIQLNVKKLSKMMMATGGLLAEHIDRFVEKKVPTYPKGKLTDTIKNGTNHVGRILHYFPYENKGATEDDWCGWHNDHGSLTALASAMYCDENGKEITFPLKTGGLYAKNRFAEMAKIAIPKTMLAFQLGESTQIHSGGVLEATPHCVVRSDELGGTKIGRNTFALFMEPDPLEKMQVPQNIDPKDVNEKEAYNVPQIKDRWHNGIMFKEFHSNTIKYYS